MKEWQEMVKQWIREVELEDAPKERRPDFLQAYFQERRRQRPDAGR